jgi:Tol biopolymer transport system component/DNA-binding winged helix-turn-helix (wHTH) protein
MTPPGANPACRVRFDGFEADLWTEELFRSGQRIRLRQQSFRVLAFLLERQGQLVTREELRARLWPAGTLVEHDQGLNTAITRLREALGDSAEAPRFIETLPKRGYRFIGAVQLQSLPLSAVDPDVPREPATAEVSRADLETPADGSPDAPADTGSVPTPGVPRSPRRFLLVAAVGLGAIALILGALWTVNNPPVAGLPFGQQVVPFTSLPGQALAPSFSPDGSQIAFAWNGAKGADDQFDLYVKSLASERLLRLTQKPSKSITPVWSPDGSTIAFVRETEESSGIFVMPAVGGSERSIVSQGITKGSYVQISWSPDGHRLAYSAYGPQGGPQVYIVSLDSLHKEPLSPAPECPYMTEPAFSPDGKRLAFICISGAAVYDIYAVELPQGPVRRLVRMLGYPQGLTWFADGRRVVLSNDAGDGGELWQLTLKGQLSRLPFGYEASAPAIAARGARMAYVRGRSTVDIWRADLMAPHPDESTAKLIYSTRIQTLPRYSPDGTRIAFQSNRSGSTEIWLADPQGADLDRLTAFNGPVTNAPAWCSGGRIAFDSRASGLSAIYIEDLSERVPRKVSTSRANLAWPVWSQDCRWLFATDPNYRLYRVPSAGGPAELFTDHPSTYSSVSGERLVFNVTRADGIVLWVKPVDGGPEAPLEGMPKLSYADAWVAGRTGIYYTDALSRPVTINYYDFASRTTRSLMTLKQAPVTVAGPGISVSPDGRWLLYSQTDDQQSEIMLVPGR